jgi:glycine cleavage system aminomethyltransferase T/glycine/D-amino acid oxidase-like deaminating enzyme
MMYSLPIHTRVVIVGGGIVGCSAAYHLAKAGWKDVLLLEQNRIAGGTTWHAAGLVTRLRGSHTMAILHNHSARLYASLPAETGYPTGWRQVGSLLLARTADRATQIRRNAALARLFDVDCHEIAPAEAARHWPGLRTNDLVAAFFLPEDGRVEPAETARSLAKGAELHGATIREGVRVRGLTWDGRRVTGVRTDHGDISAEHVLLCAGMWTRQLAVAEGIDVPLFPVEHHYVETAPLDGVTDDLPATRDYDGAIYLRSIDGRIRFGAFQHGTRPLAVDRVPDDFSFRLFDPDWETFAPALAEARHRLPLLATAKLDRFVNGPESFTPDATFLLGPVAGRGGLFVAAGFNSFGIAGAGGAGWAIAEWLRHGEPPLDLWAVDPRRFGPAMNDVAFLRARVPEVLGHHYAIAYPTHEYATGRDLRRSPVHDRTAARGACFGQRFGWERPLWYATDGRAPVRDDSFDRPSWFADWAAEHRATRERVALFDQSSFGKYLVEGPDACALLNWLCGNDVDVLAGRIVYTGMFNARGTFESDLTVVRLAADRFYVITAAAQTLHDFDWIDRAVRARNARVNLTDVSADYGVLGLMGPRARDLLQPLTNDDLANDSYPFGTARWIDLGSHRALAARITYVGELGWELHIPADSCCQTAAVFDDLVAAGELVGLALAGTIAQNSLRLEKGYVAWGHDVSPDDTPLEAGLGFAVAWDKPGGFLGRDALLQQKATGIRRRLVTFTLDDPEPLLWGGEPILRNGRSVGYTTSGSYAHTLGSAIGMGYVGADEPVTGGWIEEGNYEIDVAGRRFAARPHLRAPFDPQRTRILA